MSVQKNPPVHLLVISVHALSVMTRATNEGRRLKKAGDSVTSQKTLSQILKWKEFSR